MLTEDILSLLRVYGRCGNHFLVVGEFWVPLSVRCLNWRLLLWKVRKRSSHRCTLRTAFCTTLIHKRALILWTTVWMAFIAFRMQQLFYVIVIHRLFLLIISFISGRLLGLRRLLTWVILFFPITPRARHFKSVKEKRCIIFGTLLTHADLPLPHTTFPGGVAWWMPLEGAWGLWGRLEVGRMVTGTGSYFNIGRRSSHDVDILHL